MKMQPDTNAKALKPLSPLVPTQAPETLTVSAPPHVRRPMTMTRMTQETLFALLPAASMAASWFGLDAVRVMALSCAVAVATEALCCKAMGRRVSVDDYTAMVTGLLFAFLLPASAPWWLVAFGAAVSISLGKMAFGGLGCNPLCAPLAGWALCSLSWPQAMDVDIAMLGSELYYPLSELKYYGLEAVDHFTWSGLLTGAQLGGLGATQTAGLLAGAAWLLARRIIRWHIPSGFLLGTASAAFVFAAAYPQEQVGPLFHLLTGSVILGAFFLATDYGSSPVGRLAMFVYGLLAGAMVMVIRVYGVYPDGVVYAILLANLFTPLLDRLQPKPFGGGHG